MKNSRSENSQAESNSSPSHSDKLAPGPVREALTDFLVQASSEKDSQLCPNCGQRMHYVTTTFSLYGSDASWKIQVPICSCAPPKQDLPPIQPIHRTPS